MMTDQNDSIRGNENSANDVALHKNLKRILEDANRGKVPNGTRENLIVRKYRVVLFVFQDLGARDFIQTVNLMGDGRELIKIPRTLAPRRSVACPYQAFVFDRNTRRPRRVRREG
jgi:hypothetical protein